MLEVRNLSITTLSGRKILENVSFLANDGDKIAIIGEEGNGKTTLLRAIVNRESLSGSFIVNGTIKTDSNNIGYLEQILDPAWNDLTALDYILQDTPTSEPNYEIYNDFGDIAQIASQFGLKEDFLDGVQPIGTLSGGEKVKLQLLKLMYKKPTLILMDEPTNDLDISTLEFLEDFINKKPVLLYMFRTMKLFWSIQQITFCTWNRLKEKPNHEQHLQPPHTTNM